MLKFKTITNKNFILNKEYYERTIIFNFKNNYCRVESNLNPYDNEKYLAKIPTNNIIAENTILSLEISPRGSFGCRKGREDLGLIDLLYCNAGFFEITPNDALSSVDINIPIEGGYYYEFLIPNNAYFTLPRYTKEEYYPYIDKSIIWEEVHLYCFNISNIKELRLPLTKIEVVFEEKQKSFVKDFIDNLCKIYQIDRGMVYLKEYAHEDGHIWLKSYYLDNEEDINYLLLYMNFSDFYQDFQVLLHNKAIHKVKGKFFQQYKDKLEKLRKYIINNIKDVDVGCWKNKIKEQDIENLFFEIFKQCVEYSVSTILKQLKEKGVLPC